MIWPKRLSYPRMVFEKAQYGAWIRIQGPRSTALISREGPKGKIRSLYILAETGHMKNDCHCFVCSGPSQGSQSTTALAYGSPNAEFIADLLQNFQFEKRKKRRRQKRRRNKAPPIVKGKESKIVGSMTAKLKQPRGTPSLQAKGKEAGPIATGKSQLPGKKR